jgi:hypothetical protein
LANELNLQFSREVKMTNKYMKKCSTILAIKVMQIKTILRHHLSPVRMTITKKEQQMPAREQEKRNPYPVVRNVT